MGEDRAPTPRYVTYATPEAPSLPTPPTPTPSALPDPSPSDTATLDPPAPTGKVDFTRTLTPSPRKVTAQSLNLRKGPGTNYDRYGDPLPQGTIVMHTGDAQEVGGETWMEVSYRGRLGWVSGRFLGPVDTVTAPPATSTSRPAPMARPATLFEVPQAEAPAAPARQSRKVNSGFSCGGKRYCNQMSSCAEANYYLHQCGLYRLDRDGDGYPCESGPC
ncbi:excalibur calcium-binding domain-containing protein [Inquilinus limosus]